MDREIINRKAQERGLRAKALLDNQLLQDAFTAIHESLIKEWTDTKPDDKDRREDAWRSLKLLGLLKNSLEKHVRDGEIASKDLLKVKGTGFLQNMIK